MDEVEMVCLLIGLSLFLILGLCICLRCTEPGKSEEEKMVRLWLCPSREEDV